MKNFETDIQVRPARWRAFEKLHWITKQETRSSRIAQDLLRYSHNRANCDVAELWPLDSDDTGALTLTAHFVNGSSTEELTHHIRQNPGDLASWMNSKIYVGGISQ